jgi:alpha-tubulin suppressor-like RCC1 family protein
LQVQRISSKRHLLGLASGGVRCWGENIQGQLGDGTTTNRSIPPTSDVLSGVAAIAAGNAHTCALMTTGGIRCWGANGDGRLGILPPVHWTPMSVVGTCEWQAD